jgi:hypothetical protein
MVLEEYMKITIDGKEFELVPILAKGVDEMQYALKPVKKTEKKEYRIIFSVEGKGVSHLFDEEYEFTEEAAHKLSEAISALVEHTTSNDFTGAKKNKLIDKAIEAKASFQESQ